MVFPYLIAEWYMIYSQKILVNFVGWTKSNQTGHNIKMYQTTIQLVLSSNIYPKKKRFWSWKSSFPRCHGLSINTTTWTSWRFTLDHVAKNDYWLSQPFFEQYICPNGLTSSPNSWDEHLPQNLINIRGWKFQTCLKLTNWRWSSFPFGIATNL